MILSIAKFVLRYLAAHPDKALAALNEIDAVYVAVKAHLKEQK